MMTPCFVNVADAEAGIDLTSLKIGGDYASGDVTVETLDSLGRLDKDYSFIKDRKGNWYWSGDDGKVEEGDVIFPVGKGLWVAGVDSTSLTSAGAVSTNDNTINLQEGFVACGNMTAVPVDLTSIVPGGDYASGDITIETLDSLGNLDKDYSFIKDRKGNWYWSGDDGKVEEGEIFFAPGKGLWVAGVDGASITIPGPTL